MVVVVGHKLGNMMKLALDLGLQGGGYSERWHGPLASAAGVVCFDPIVGLMCSQNPEHVR